MPLAAALWKVLRQGSATPERGRGTHPHGGTASLVEALILQPETDMLSVLATERLVFSEVGRTFSIPMYGSRIKCNSL